MTHVALLRGINVGPSSRIAMADLRDLFEQLGCTSVRTLLQSGNVLFDGSVTAAGVEKAIVARFGYSSRVLILTAAEFTRVISENPMVDVAHDPSKMVITFLESMPAGISLPTIDPPELIAITDRALYQWCPDGILQSKVSPEFWRSLGPRVTSRNLRTVDKIAALLEA